MSLVFPLLCPSLYLYLHLNWESWHHQLSENIRFEGYQTPDSSVTAHLWTRDGRNRIFYKRSSRTRKMQDWYSQASLTYCLAALAVLYVHLFTSQFLHSNEQSPHTFSSKSIYHGEVKLGSSSFSSWRRKSSSNYLLVYWYIVWWSNTVIQMSEAKSIGAEWVLAFFSCSSQRQKVTRAA